MEKIEHFELPPGFRFHPTDEELITHYLSKKVLDTSFSAAAIGQVDLNKCEPWDMPRVAKMGENEWYFFCVKDRKYPTGLRTNRATDAGYWKATGKDKEILKENGPKTLIGMKKTLVFYEGRAPKGEKTNWVMHEYRLEGKHSKNNPLKAVKSEWVICRVFHKSPCRKKMHVSGLGRLSFSSFEKEPPQSSSSLLPPLMDSSPYNSETKTTAGELSHVTCFSDPNQTEEVQKTQQGDKDNIVDSFEETPFMPSLSPSRPSDISPASWSFPKATTIPSVSHQIGNSQYQEDGFLLQMLIENNGSSSKQNQKTEFSQQRDFDADLSSVIYNNGMFQRSFGNQEHSSAYAGPVDIGSLWNY